MPDSPQIGKQNLRGNPQRVFSAFRRSFFDGSLSENAVFLGSIAVILVFLFFPSDTAAASGHYLSVFLRVVFPTLFPSMAAGKMLMKGFSGKMRTEHASAELPAVLIGWFCGFPAGASAAAELYKNGVCSAKEAERIAAVSSAASPVFVISFVGQTLFGSARAGIAIEAAQLSASLITSLIFGKLLPKNNDFALPKSRKNGGNAPVFPGIADTVVYGITDAARASVSLCGFLVFFGTVSAHIGKLCLSLGISPVVSALLSGVFEITSGCSSAVEACGDTVFSPLFVGFSVGFSGLSVIFQSLSLLRENGIGCRAFFLSRLLSGFLCSLFCTAAYCLFSALRFI